MGDAKVVRKKMQRLRQKADRLERGGRYDEAAEVHEAQAVVEAELIELRRQGRVARRRERVLRNAKIYAGDMVLTNPDDIASMLRLAIEIDAAYHPDSWVKGEPRE